MGYQGNRRFGPIVDEYGPLVGGHRYKKVRPEPLAITILKLVASRSSVLRSAQSILEEIKSHTMSKVEKKRIQQGLQYLKRKKFIAFPGKGKFTITMSGKKRLEKIELDNIRISKPEAWDGKWRLLTFDIPEEMQNLRYYFRKRLKEIGFYHFQRSVFVIPYPCVSEIDKICVELGIERSVHLIKAYRFEGDGDLTKHFQID